MTIKLSFLNSADCWLCMFSDCRSTSNTRHQKDMMLKKRNEKNYQNQTIEKNAHNNKWKCVRKKERDRGEANAESEHIELTENAVPICYIGVLIELLLCVFVFRFVWPFANVNSWFFQLWQPLSNKQGKKSYRNEIERDGVYKAK